MAGSGWSLRTSSELLLFINFLLTLVAVSFAIGTYPKREWLTTSLVAAILVTMQLMNWLPTNIAHALGEKIVLYVTPTQNLGSSGWRDSYSADFATLLIYSWTPLLALACGRVTRVVSPPNPNVG